MIVNTLSSESPKNIPDILDCNLKKDCQILPITQMAIKRPFKFPPHPMCASALPGEIGTHEIGVEMNQKR